MPIYERFDCGRRSSFPLLRIDSVFAPSCRHCHGTRMSRVISRAAVLRSEESHLESLTAPSASGLRILCREKKRQLLYRILHPPAATSSSRSE
jgi:hypothetical protein